MSANTTPQPVADQSMTLKEATEYLGVAQSTLREWTNTGKIPSWRTSGGHRRFKKADLDAFMQAPERFREPQVPEGSPLRLLEQFVYGYLRQLESTEGRRSVQMDRHTLALAEELESLGSLCYQLAAKMKEALAGSYRRSG